MQYGDPVWEAIYQQRVWGQYPSEEAVRFVKRALARGIAGRDALDIGAGQGACTWMLMREGLNPTAMEGSPSGAAKINATVRSFGIDAEPEVVCGDILRPSDHLKDRKFHLFLDHYSLYANAKTAIESAYREYSGLCETGAYLLTCCFGKRTTGYGLGRQVEKDSYTDIPAGCLAHRGTATFFDSAGLASMLERCGFKVVYTEVFAQDSGETVIEKIAMCLQKA